MKEYFKYGRGYVNINEEFLFLTNSGNWSEIQNIEEKSPKSIKRNKLKSLKNNLFYVILLGLLFYSNTGLEADRFKAGFLIVALGISAYFYMKRETGNKYKIPLSKISTILINKSEVNINFINADDTEDFEVITNVEEKGLKILSKIPAQSI
jgi:hypothetical protein